MQEEEIKEIPRSSYRSAVHAETHAPTCGGFYFIEYHCIEDA
jgi:hypothetical protein